jgi:hypothetical protein
MKGDAKGRRKKQRVASSTPMRRPMPPPRPRNGWVAPVLFGTPTGIKAVCVRDEMLRLRGLLEKRGASVHSWLPNLPGGLCALNEGARKKLFEQGHDGETVVTLSCETGKKNVESILPDSQVVAAMNARGLLRVVTRRRFGQVLIDKKTVDILEFTFDQ